MLPYHLLSSVNQLLHLPHRQTPLSTDTPSPRPLSSALLSSFLPSSSIHASKVPYVRPSVSLSPYPYFPVPTLLSPQSFPFSTSLRLPVLLLLLFITHYLLSFPFSFPELLPSRLLCCEEGRYVSRYVGYGGFGFFIFCSFLFRWVFEIRGFG